MLKLFDKISITYTKKIIKLNIQTRINFSLQFYYLPQFLWKNKPLYTI